MLSIALCQVCYPITVLCSFGSSSRKDVIFEASVDFILLRPYPQIIIILFLESGEEVQDCQVSVPLPNLSYPTEYPISSPDRDVIGQKLGLKWFSGPAAAEF